MSSIGKSGARSAGPTGWPVAGWRMGGSGAGRSACKLYQWVGRSFSSSRILRGADSVIVMLSPQPPAPAGSKTGLWHPPGSPSGRYALARRRGKDRQRSLDHRVARGDRDPEVAGHLEHGAGQDVDVLLGEEPHERPVIGPRGLREQVESAFR